MCRGWVCGDVKANRWRVRAGSEDEFSRNNESDFFVKENHENTTKRQESESALQVCGGSAGLCVVCSV